MADSASPSPASPETQASSAPAQQSGAPPHGGDGAPALAAGHEMSFLDHLEELRWTIFKALGGVAIMVVVCVFFRRWIIREVLLGPTSPDFFMYGLLGVSAEPIELLNRTITGQFFADLGTIIVVGLIMGSPLVVYALWQFVEPALYPHEKSGLRFASVFATFFFILGISFGYLILTPLALQFFQSYSLSAQIINQFDITKYFSMVTFWALGTGILFELPVAIYFLSKLGVVTPETLRTYRKYALLVILVLAAFFTPPDPISQILVAVPLLLLYEFSIFVSAYSERRRRKALEKAARQGKI